MGSNYLDKYKGNGGRNSIYNILSLDHNDPEDWEIIDKNYKATYIKSIKIEGNEFSHYSAFQFAWEKTYSKQPQRSLGGVIGNLNALTTFVVPHLIINFSLLSIDDYRKIIQLDLSKNEFTVECYDPIYNDKFVGKMYLATPEMAKLYTIAKVRFNENEWEEYVEIVGVEDYTVELIGTNADVELVSVTYYLNAPQNTYPDSASTRYAEDDVYNGEEIILGNAANAIISETFGGKKVFNGWNTAADGSGTNYINGNSYIVNGGLNLYAQWKDTTSKTLFLNYGIAPTVIDNYEEVTRISVVNGKAIGELPNPTPIPTVVFDGVVYYDVYSNGGWWRTSKKVDDSEMKVTSTTLYWSDRDDTIYYLYDIKRCSIVFSIIEGAEEIKYSTVTAEYNTPIAYPNPLKSGYVFDGWYMSKEFEPTTKYNGNMPPTSLNLYGRFIENKQ
jgi:uncharacterized repeat protein (TIGR02543 family)